MKRPVWIALRALGLTSAIIVGLIVGEPLALPIPALAQDRAPPPQRIRPAGSEVQIFGKDTRREPPARYNELKKSVGQLETPVGSKLFLCTAFCVADNVVATAAHCLFEPQVRNHLSRTSIAIGQGPDRRITTIHGRNEEEIQWSIIAGATAAKTEEIPLKWAHDWALVRMAAPVCKERSLSVLTTGDFATSWRKALERDVFILGYHADKGPRTLRYSDDCSNSDAPFEPDMARWLDTMISLNSEEILPSSMRYLRGFLGRSRILG